MAALRLPQPIQIQLECFKWTHTIFQTLLRKQQVYGTLPYKWRVINMECF
jgi:hypothetical protein